MNIRKLKGIEMKDSQEWNSQPVNKINWENYWKWVEPNLDEGTLKQMLEDFVKNKKVAIKVAVKYNRELLEDLTPYHQSPFY